MPAQFGFTAVLKGSYSEARFKAWWRWEMTIGRRDLIAILPAVVAQSALVGVLAEGSAAQTASGSASAPAGGAAKVLPSAVYTFESLPVKKSATSESRAIMKGKLATGEAIEVHETTLDAGGSPHPPHHHEHSEMWLIREGTVEITIEGKAQRVGPGGLAFVKSNEEHGITNPTDVRTTYFVVAVGPGADA
jgi:mannose-6-phosphate isomerase-like protein (cupin superfamily)